MKLNTKFITHEMSGQQIMVSTDTNKFSGLVRSNRTAADIVECLKVETTKEQIVKYMIEKYDVTKEQLLVDVERILGILREIGALDE